MPLHALASARPAPQPFPSQDYAFDPRLPQPERGLLLRLLEDLYRLGLMPQMASCCCFAAELVAALLRRNGIAAQALPCRVTIEAPAGIAFLGPGFATPGQIDAHFAVAAGTMLVDWALAPARRVPRLGPLPLGFAVPRDHSGTALASGVSGETHRLVWEAVEPSSEVARLHRAEKLKAARVLHQASLKRGRPR